MKQTRTSLTSLESVAQQFAHWRATRTKRGRIPKELWALVTPLTDQYSFNEIVKALRINHMQLKENTSKSPSIKQHDDLPAFVEYSIPLPPSSTENCIVEFTCKNGKPVKISGVQTSQMQSIISLLMGV